MRILSPVAAAPAAAESAYTARTETQAHTGDARRGAEAHTPRELPVATPSQRAKSSKARVAAHAKQLASPSSALWEANAPRSRPKVKVRGVTVEVEDFSYNQLLWVYEERKEIRKKL